MGTSLARMAAGILTVVIAFLSGGGLWLAKGPRLRLSDDDQTNDLLNLVAYVGASVPVAFALVLFVLELL